MTSFDELADPDGRLSRPLRTRGWDVPKPIELQDKALRWREPNPKRERVRLPLAKVLTDFTGLAQADDLRVLKFARRWGPLNLCEHGFPRCHRPFYWPTRPSVNVHACPYDERPVSVKRGDFHRCEVQGAEEGCPWEPVEAWRTWARRAQATLQAAAHLHQRTLPDTATWRIACDAEGMPTGPGWWAPPRRLGDGWALMDYMLGFWLEGAEVRPMLERRNGKPTITWGSSHAPLFGTIAVQLLMLVTQTAGLAQCSGCGNSYIPRRQPREQQRSYCADCRARKVPQRDAQRDKRSRTKLRV